MRYLTGVSLREHEMRSMWRRWCDWLNDRPKPRTYLVEYQFREEEGAWEARRYPILLPVNISKVQFDNSGSGNHPVVIWYWDDSGVRHNIEEYVPK